MQENLTQWDFKALNLFQFSFFVCICCNIIDELSLANWPYNPYKPNAKSEERIRKISYSSNLTL